MRQHAPSLHRLGCKACPLDKVGCHTPKMVPSLAKTTDVYILGAAPTEREDLKTGEPFTDKDGQLVLENLPDGFEERCSFDNVINCYPGDKRPPSWQETECCRPRRHKFIEQAKPRLIIGLGVSALQWMLASADMAGMRGRLFAVKVGEHECWFMPTHDINFLRATAFDADKPLNSKFGHAFRMDLKLAARALDGLKPPHVDTPAEVRANIEIFDGHGGPKQFDRLMQLMKQAKAAKIKATDLETRFLRPYTEGADLMTAAISFGDTNFAWAVRHPRTGWTRQQLDAIMQAYRDVLADDSIKVAHNTPFELEWFITEYGREVVNHLAWEDTMMQACFINERKGARQDDDSKASRYQSLGFLCQQHFGIEIKGQFKLNKKDMAKADLTETLIYNGADTKYTLRLYHRQFQLMKALGVEPAYRDAAPRQPTVALMQSIGVTTDQATVLGFQKKLEGEVAAIRAEMDGLKVVQAYVKDNKAFNPFSPDDLVKIFRDYLKRNEIAKELEREGAAAKYSTDKGVLDQIDHPLAKLLIQLRNRSKLKSTYVDKMLVGAPDAFVYPDGLLHTSYNTTVAETGRLSSDGPNLQNFPKRADAWIRKGVKPPRNHVVVAVDYGQLEACSGAMCSRDKYLTKALWEDYDIHMEWAQKTAHIMPQLIGGKKFLQDKAVMKKFRSLIKNKLVFPALFGAQDTSIKGYLEVATGEEAPIEDVRKLFDEFWASFHGFKAWQDRLMKKYYDEGYVETLSGRRRSYPLTRNQAINAPIQGTAAEIVCDAMVRMSMIAAESGKWHLHPVMNIHDDLTYFIPDDDAILEDALNIISREMMVFDFPWINVPLSIEISIGPDWCDLEGLGEKLWSHKEHQYPRAAFV